jgi:hypothetical protein
MNKTKKKVVFLAQIYFSNEVWWYMLVIPAFVRWRQEDCEFKASLNYIVTNQNNTILYFRVFAKDLATLEPHSQCHLRTCREERVTPLRWADLSACCLSTGPMYLYFTCLGL